MAAMRSLLAAAVAVAAAAFHSAGAGPRVETIYSHANTTIAAFAQDGALVAWFSPSRSRCNTVHVISLANPLQTTLPLQGTARNVTCRWVVGSSPVTLALAGGNVLWTLQERSPIPFDYLLGAGVGVGERKERRFQEIAHTNHGSGLWLGGTSGDGARSSTASPRSTTSTRRAASPARAAASSRSRAGASTACRGDSRRSSFPAPTPAAPSKSQRRRVPSRTCRRRDVGKQGRPLTGADLPIEVVDALTGASISRVSPQGTPLAITLAPHVLATLERTPLGLRLAWYDRATGAPRGLGAGVEQDEPRAQRDRPHDRLPRRPLDSSRRRRDPQRAHARACSSGARRALARGPAPRVGREREGAQRASARCEIKP